MILVVGGACSGKRDFVKDALGFTDEDFSSQAFSTAPVAFDVQDMLRVCSAADLFAYLREKQVVVCNEVGCGIVPLDPDERQWREDVGRLTCDLAQQATAVVRLVCGIPQVIKGTL